MGDMDSQNGEYTESNDQTQPEYGQQYDQPQYGQDQAQPEYGQQYDQQQYAQPQYDQQQYAQPQYSDPQYTQPQYNQQYTDYSQNEVVVSKRSKMVAALLAFFFGFLGVHNFYLGKNGRGFAQLLITVVSFGTLTFVSGIWAFIEFIMILCSKPGSEYHQDGDGAELQD
ncbi:TM2 domain-containing protein [Gardnerella vaginalis]|uniref:TM2 domain-containing protein n=1 Tax=Gardnerella vaginalis TaxID=2702 RepID=UPI0039EF9FFB